jgi:Uma2 family endonuclease
MTADELLELTGPERYELLRGKLIEMGPTGFEHGDVGNVIAWFLTTYVREHRLGRVTNADVGFRLSSDPDTVFAPDTAFVRADRLPPRAERTGYLPLAPDLVVEVLSPSDRPGQVATKISAYQVFGVHTIWLVDPSE